MQLSDRKYKMFFDTEGIRDAFVGLACERLELGQPDLESVEVLTPVRDVEVWGRLLETVQDQCWRFRTQQEDGVLLACEVQSSAEYLILMRLVAYASVTLVSLDRTEHFSRRRPVPVPCLFLIYTGEAAWTPTPLDELMRGYVPVAGPLFPYIYMDVRHDDFSAWGLPRELDLMVRAERTNTAEEFLRSGYLTDVRTLRDPNTVKALVDFMRRTMQGWSRQSAQDKAILDALQLDWESVTTPEELAMAAVEIRRGYVAVKEAGRQEGHQVGLQEGHQAGLQEGHQAGLREGLQEGLREGLQEGLQEGLLTGARQTKVDMLCEVLQPVAGQQFVDELRVWLEDEGLLARLETNSIIDLRIRYGADPDSLRQAVRNLLGKA